MYPADYVYSKEHEWVATEDGVCTLGVTQFAQEELGEIVFVELPEVGDTFEARLIAEATAPIRRHFGKPPAGWLGPYIVETPVTADLLRDSTDFTTLAEGEREEKPKSAEMGDLSRLAPADPDAVPVDDVPFSGPSSAPSSSPTDEFENLPETGVDRTPPEAGEPEPT